MQRNLHWLLWAKLIWWGTLLLHYNSGSLGSCLVVHRHCWWCFVFCCFCLFVWYWLALALLVKVEFYTILLFGPSTLGVWPLLCWPLLCYCHQKICTCSLKTMMYFESVNLLMLNRKLIWSPGTMLTVLAGSCTGWTNCACVNALVSYPKWCVERFGGCFACLCKRVFFSAVVECGPWVGNDSICPHFVPIVVVCGGLGWVVFVNQFVWWSFVLLGLLLIQWAWSYCFVECNDFVLS